MSSDGVKWQTVSPKRFNEVVRASERFKFIEDETIAVEQNTDDSWTVTLANCNVEVGYEVTVRAPTLEQAIDVAMEQVEDDR